MEDMLDPTNLQSLVLNVLLFMFVFQFIFAPIVIRFIVKQSINPKLKQITMMDVPQFIRNRFAKTEAQLKHLDFVGKRLYRVDDLVPKTPGVIALYYKKQAREIVADIAIFRESQGKEQIDMNYHEVYFEFSDGESISFVNSARLFPMGFKKIKKLYEFPMLKNPADLYQLQTRLVVHDKDMLGKMKRPMGEDIEHHMMQSLIADIVSKERAGILIQEGTSDTYRATWKGAFILAFGFMFPISTIRRAIRRLKAWRLMKKVGFKKDRRKLSAQ